MFKKLKNTTDEIDKRSLMAEMEKIIENDLPWVMQHYTRSYVLHNNRLRNFRHSDIIYNGIKYYKLSDE
jgi:ABC-type transport system substrate-binding protein